MYSIRLEAMQAIIEAAKNTFPNEFIGMLGGNKKEKIIDELIVVSATFGESHSSIYSHLVPFDPKIMGTIHSHPNESSRPSNTDLNTFAKLGEVHIIIANPFDFSSTKCYSAKGKIARLKIIE
ncbi:MAG: Mov34/MPN/PAD-1 family protein [archaeon]